MAETMVEWLISRSPATISGTRLTDPSNASGRSALTASIQTTSISLSGYYCRNAHGAPCSPPIGSGLLGYTGVQYGQASVSAVDFDQGTIRQRQHRLRVTKIQTSHNR